MSDDEQALYAVLGESHEDVPLLARQAAERDVAAIRRGLTLLAVDTPRPARPRQRHIGQWVAIAAAVVTVVVGVVVGVVLVGPASTRDAGNDTQGPAIGLPAMPLTLQERVDGASHIVIGTVTTVDRGTIDAQLAGEQGDHYVLATVRVDEAIKGQGVEVIAFSYDYGSAITIEGTTRPWNVGDRVLLFLLPDVDTISADIEPRHMQVAEGQAGRYFVDGDRLVDADFTLDDVRRAAK